MTKVAHKWRYLLRLEKLSPLIAIVCLMSQPSAPSERPLRRDAERNRQRILDAAKIVFAERGLRASHDDIADQAGVGVGTVYRRFPDKELLIDALFEERLEEIADVAREGLAIADPWDGLVHFVTRAQELQSADRGLKEIALGTAHGQHRAARARARISPIVAQILERAKQAGVVRADLALSDMPLIQLAVGTIADSTRDIAPDTWRRLMTIILDGMRVGAAGPSELTAPPLDFDQVPAAMHNAGAAKHGR